MDKSEISKKIRDLRQALALNQRAFGALLDVTQKTISVWENPKSEEVPSIEKLLDLAGKAHGEDAAFFLRQAGISTSKMAEIVKSSPQQGIQSSLTYVGARESQISRGVVALAIPDVVPVPILKNAAAAGQPREIDEKDIETVLMVPHDREWAPHASSLVALKIKGDSMSPLLLDGYVVVVDTSQNTRRMLYDEMVAARGPDGGVTIKWLRKSGKQEMLIAQHTSPRHQPTVITDEDEWRVIGKVVWWIGKPPKKWA